VVKQQDSEGRAMAKSSEERAGKFLERLARTYPHLSENRGEDDLLRLHAPKQRKGR
jgi:hypothetical protein